MTYALDRGLFLENGPALLTAKAASRRSSARIVGWRGLNSDGRLAIVEQALKPAANDLHDSYPVAL